MLLFADSFEQYGNTPNGGRDAMMAGEYIEVTHTSISVSQNNARTGEYSLFMASSGTGTRGVRRSLKSPQTAFGLAFGIYYDEGLPHRPDFQGIQLRDSANNAIASILVNPDGSWNVRRGGRDGQLVGATDIVLSSQAYSFVEMKFVIDPIVGYIEIRVDSEVVFVISDVDLGTTAVTNVGYYQRLPPSGDTGTITSVRWDDLVAWDDTGDFNNDFPGPVRVLTHFPEVVTAAADWVAIGTVSPIDAINNVPPDGDTTYLGADAVNLVSEFTLPELPPEVIAVRGIYVPAMARIEDAGVGNIQVSMISNGQVDAGPEIPLTPVYTYRGSAFQSNPDGDVEWTKGAYEAALIRIEKTE